ncbi:glucose-6-phosphate isomerase [Methylophilaceae bacterium]|jgi:glucose-6-phosphate isomerase|nr:glucose-6-phosphate isomerase [Methylophilaceae bacterium]
MSTINKSSSWKALNNHFEKIKSVHMRDLFNNDDNRFNKYHIQYEDFLVDFSKNRITDETLNLLLTLAKDAKVEDWRDRLFSGDKINFTENRSALHIALRNRSNKPILLDGKDIMPNVNQVLAQIKSFSNDVRNGKAQGYTGKKIKSVVNIGIGGSDLGPAMVCEALKSYGTKDITPHFVSNIDGADISQTLELCDPETTLFIVASKTFTTQETMTNAYSARAWLLKYLKDRESIKNHFVAISTNEAAVEKFGIHKDNMFEFWDWVGGRYSLWSAIGLSIAIFLGMEKFEQLLDGAHDIDNHFKNAPLQENIPVMLALLGVWYINFFKFNTHAVLPYDQGLSLFPSYLQQADMESNGKFIDRSGEKIQYNSGPILWGESGTNGQHAFYQLIHQGTVVIPSDFIMPIHSHYSIGNNGNEHHKILIANFIAQTQSLMMGKTNNEARAELKNQGLDENIIKTLTPHKTFEGNRPSTSILFDKLNPKSLGRLIAIYEHKIFTQGIIWNINSFDQWGVEYGKQIAKLVLPKLIEPNETSGFDSSTNNLINYTKKNI